MSDESSDARLVIDGGTLTKRSVTPLGGEAGNTLYDRNRRRRRADDVPPLLVTRDHSS